MELMKRCGPKRDESRRTRHPTGMNPRNFMGCILKSSRGNQCIVRFLRRPESTGNGNGWCQFDHKLPLCHHGK